MTRNKSSFWEQYDKSAINIFTDGSLKKVDNQEVYPGIGIFCDDSRFEINLSLTLKDPPLTNAHAELAAVHMTLEKILESNL